MRRAWLTIILDTRTSEWNTTSAQVILEGTVGKVQGLLNDKDLIYGKDNLLNPNFIAR